VTALLAFALLAAAAGAALAPWWLLLIPVLVGERVIAGRDPRLPGPHKGGDELVGFLYPRRAGCWLLIGPRTAKRTCRLPVYREGLCRWHAAFAARKPA
jgi:hypothetical protein